MFSSLSSSDLYQHRADVLRRAPSTGGAERRHRRVPNGDENITHERQHVEPQQLHVLQQADLGMRGDQHRLMLNCDIYLGSKCIIALFPVA